MIDPITKYIIRENKTFQSAYDDFIRKVTGDTSHKIGKECDLEKIRIDMSKAGYRQFPTSSNIPKEFKERYIKYKKCEDEYQIKAFKQLINWLNSKGKSLCKRDINCLDKIKKQIKIWNVEIKKIKKKDL